MSRTLNAAEQVTLANALYAAAQLADKDAAMFRVVPKNERMADQFAAQAKGYRQLAERIDEAGSVVLTD